MSPALRFEIADLYTSYAICLDEQRYAEWPEFFVDDCRYELIPRENFLAGHPLATMALESKAMLRDRVHGIVNTLFHTPYYQRHIIGSQGISVMADGTIKAEANYLVIRTKRNQLSEVFNTGRYLDRIVRTAEGLRFAEKRCIFDSELIPNSIIYPI